MIGGVAPCGEGEVSSQGSMFFMPTSFAMSVVGCLPT